MYPLYVFLSLFVIILLLSLFVFVFPMQLFVNCILSLCCHLFLHQEDEKFNAVPEESKKDMVKVTEDALNLEKISRDVSCNSAGGVSFFVGTTRDNFQGKRVLQLEYEAYIPMAEKELKKICQKIRHRWDVVHIALYHRVKTVPIGEASVIVAVSW